MSGFVGPLEESGVGLGVRFEGLPQFFDEPPAVSGHSPVFHRRLEYLAQVVEGRFLADGYLAANETSGEGLVFQMGKKMGFAGSEIAGDQHSQSAGRRADRIRDPGQQIREIAFRVRLVTAQDFHRIPIGHAVSEGFEGTSAGQDRVFSKHGEHLPSGQSH